MKPPFLNPPIPPSESRPQKKPSRYWVVALTTLVSSLVILLNSCGFYSFTGASISPETKTISIQYFPNNAQLVQPGLSQKFTDALKDKFQSQTSLTLVPKGGNLMIEGAITGYSIQPVAIQGNQTAALNRLTITVEVKFTNNLNEKQNFETTFSRFLDFPSTQNLNPAQEDQLITDINSALVEDIFNKAVVNW